MAGAKVLAVAALVLATATGARAAFTQTDVYTPANFYTEFDFFSESDPTHGFVQYVDAQTANDNRLGGYFNAAVFLGLDYKTANPTDGRRSTRVMSKKAWTHGLFIADIQHMPGSICGVWPAFWLVGPNWPSGGEIDIIEGVNGQTASSMTLHTAAGCSITNAGSAGSTTLHNPDCHAGNAYQGCSQTTSNNVNYGDGFNTIGGGVYATHWTSDSISIWFWPRTGIPADVAGGSPDPATWGTPAVQFNGGSGCDIDSYFHDHHIVFDTTFCGDWAGKVWGQDAECSALASTCEHYVAAHPEAFTQAYWLVNSIHVYAES